MESDLTVVTTKNSVPVDVSHLVIGATLSGRLGTPSRNLQVQLLDTELRGKGAGEVLNGRADIQPMRGDQVIFSYKGQELFRGMWMKTTRSNKQTQTATAYDLGIYLSNNKDTFCYENPISAAGVFRDVCGRFGIPMGDVTESDYQISDLVKSKTTGWDVVQKALEQTYDATSRRFAVYATEGKLNFVEREKNMLMWVIENGVNLSSWSRSYSTEKVRTRVRVYSKEDTVVAEAIDAELEGRLGRMQDIESATEDELNEGKAQEIVNNALKNLTKPDESISVTATGIPDVITGTAIAVKIKDFDNFWHVCYVAEDTHRWDGMKYTMNLKLTPGPEINMGGDPTPVQIPEPEPEPVQQNCCCYNPCGWTPPPCGASASEGMTVQFRGGYHYVSSDASSPSGGPRSAGSATITKVAKGTPHPYHLIGTPGGSNVYGWVDAGTF